MNHNCIVCLRDGVVTPAIIGNRLCQRHFDDALAAIVATDERTKHGDVPLSVRDRRARRAQSRRAEARI